MCDWSKNQIEIIFLRHGMTIENEQHRYLGNTDTSLSRNGICKLQALQKNGTPLSKPYANIHTGVERNGFWRI